MTSLNELSGVESFIPTKFSLDAAKLLERCLRSSETDYFSSGECLASFPSLLLFLCHFSIGECLGAFPSVLLFLYHFFSGEHFTTCHFLPMYFFFFTSRVGSIWRHFFPLYFFFITSPVLLRSVIKDHSKSCVMIKIVSHIRILYHVNICNRISIQKFYLHGSIFPWKIAS